MERQPGIRFGERVIVAREALRGDIQRAVGDNLRGRVVSVIPPNDTLAGCVLVSFDAGGANQWVPAGHVRSVSNVPGGCREG